MRGGNKIIGEIIIFLILSLLLFSLVFFGVFEFSFSSGIKISIYNNTNTTIKHLELKYMYGNNIQEKGKTLKTISKIDSKKSWKDRIKTDHVPNGENAIMLKYKDNMGISHEVCVVGYLETDNCGKSSVVINKITKNGKLIVDVKE